MLHERLNNIEATLFRALFDREFARTAWMFSRMEALFMTGAGVALSRAIAATFPNAPPEGPPSVWLAKLPDRAGTMMADLNVQGPQEAISETVLVGAIERLKKQMARRDFERRRRAGLTDEERNRMHLEIKEINGEKPETPSDDEDPFA